MWISVVVVLWQLSLLDCSDYIWSQNKHLWGRVRITGYHPVPLNIIYPLQLEIVLYPRQGDTCTLTTSSKCHISSAQPTQFTSIIRIPIPPSHLRSLIDWQDLHNIRWTLHLSKQPCPSIIPIIFTPASFVHFLILSHKKLQDVLDMVSLTYRSCRHLDCDGLLSLFCCSSQVVQPA
jgi:hypothetical protein